jgi:hypothetical protein
MHELRSGDAHHVWRSQTHAWGQQKPFRLSGSIASLYPKPKTGGST